MTIRRFVVPITVDENGDAEVYSPVLSGKLVSFRYVKDDFAGDDLAFTITAEGSGETLWAEEDVTASATRYPRAATHSTAGAAALRADTGEAVLAPIALSQDRVKFVIAGAGNETSGAFHITVDG
ncbi:MAG: hypothetical protein M9944_07990 [Rhizobiaceae bacterium]|nr:hypothetical protein [Rhizobiaceae bacterium]